MLYYYEYISTERMKNIEMFKMKSGSVLCQHCNLVQRNKDQSIQYGYYHDDDEGQRSHQLFRLLS